MNSQREIGIPAATPPAVARSTNAAAIAAMSAIATPRSQVV